MATQSDTVLAVQRTVKALDRVSQNLDVFFAELRSSSRFNAVPSKPGSILLQYSIATTARPFERVSPTRA